jgi:hypothetical protein
MINPYSTKCICKDQLLLNGQINIYENKEALEEWLEQIDVFIHKN